MTGTLLPRDRGHRESHPSRRSGSRRALPSAIRLVVGEAANFAGNGSESEDARRGDDRAGKWSEMSTSGSERVDSLTVLPPCGGDDELHLSADAAGDEAADGMSLPARGFHNLGNGGTLDTPKHREDFSFLGYAAVGGGLCAARGSRSAGGWLMLRLRLRRCNVGRLCRNIRRRWQLRSRRA